MRLKILFGLVILLSLTACSFTPPILNVICEEAELIDAINRANLGAGHNTLILEEDCTYELFEEDNFITNEDLPGIVGGTGLPAVSTPITIEGNNSTIIRLAGTPNFRIFFVTGTGDLTINDLSILNGAAIEGNGQGGGIYVNAGILTLNNVHVDNNSAEYGGGGIYNNEGSINITDSSISSNQTTTASGGGIQAYGGDIYIDGDSMINNNIVPINGGAIGSNLTELTVIGGQINNNEAGSDGGAIFIDGDILTIFTLEDVILEGNIAGDHGGAISAAGTTFTMMGSTFFNNQVSGATGPGMQSGGAIHLFDDAHGTIGDSLIEGNSSEGFGGAISIDKLQGGMNSIYETTIQNNTAELKGGGIYCKGSVFISGAIIHANTSLTDEGGGVYNQGELILQDTVISNNSSPLAGGGVSVYNSTLTIQGSTFQGNQSLTTGGGLSTHISNTTIVEDSLFDSNTADTQGGGIKNGQDSLMTLEDSIISNNQALVTGQGWGGGGIYNDGTMTISTTTISGNTSNYNGGGVATNGAMEISQSTINNNTAVNMGGGLWGASTVMINSTVSGNHANNSGGGVLAPISMVIVSSTIVHNTSNSAAGGLHTVSNSTIKNSIIAMNTPMNCAAQLPLNSVGANMDNDGSCHNFSLNNDPLIGPLADNGGPTWTHALLPSSPALDVATDCTDHNGAPLSFDQRGYGRPGGPECDIGAFEIPDPISPPPDAVTVTPSESYACERFIDVTDLEDDTIRIQLSTPGLPDGVYSATLGNNAFTCKTYQEYPDRLFCDGPNGKPGTLATLIVFDPMGSPFCEQTFSIPMEDVPEESPNCTKYTTAKTCNADPACNWSTRDGPCVEK